ncbi:MAG: hypothetical protein HUK08_05615, partial [Bacteroidaceae bacterium]|nr:hypothetical protein [Bacteroidaceae bacterium]
TYKELNSILPFGFIKTKISKNPKYNISYQPLLEKIEREKIEQMELSPAMKAQNLTRAQKRHKIYEADFQQDCSPDNLVSCLEKTQGANTQEQDGGGLPFRSDEERGVHP